jgi:S1-C subfamily serine protease
VGEVIGSDAATDIALVRVKAENLPSAALGDSESLKVGQFVLAIGNALGLPGAPTVSMGVISALGRPLPGTDFVLEGLVQTDAAINPGNSGGPLADLDGRVIGINTAMIPFAQGVGFAIPSDTIKRIIDQISKNGRVVRPWLGISGLDVNPSIARRYGLSVESGVLLAEVMRDSPAHAAGLREGDIVVGIGETKVEQMKGLVTALSRSAIGDRVTMSFVRTGTTYEADIRLAETPTPLLTRRR